MRRRSSRWVWGPCWGGGGTAVWVWWCGCGWGGGGALLLGLALWLGCGACEVFRGWPGFGITLYIYSRPYPPRPLRSPAPSLQSIKAEGRQQQQQRGAMAHINLYLETPGTPGAPLPARSKNDILIFLKLYSPGGGPGGPPPSLRYVGRLLLHKQSKVSVRVWGGGWVGEWGGGWVGENRRAGGEVGGVAQACGRQVCSAWQQRQEVPGRLRKACGTPAGPAEIL